MKKISIWIMLLIPFAGMAQTEIDGIMMNKNQICIGPMYTYSSWDQYWEGTLKRENLNLGTVSAQSAMVGVNYGITDDVNVMAMGSYVWTKATAGTLHGVSDFQDLSVFAKWKAYKQKFGKSKLSLIAIGGLSTPLKNYLVDYLPLSVGLGSTNLIGRGMIDYTCNRWSATISGTYTRRSNVDLDRTGYYTTEGVLSKEVEMPDVLSFNFRAGYRGKYLIAEAVANVMNTQGGFDITRNNMPFPSNDMDATTVGANVKYTFKFHTNLAVIGGANYTIKGRNVGQSMAYNAGIFYAFYLNKKDKK
jgi:hypothetical protein